MPVRIEFFAPNVPSSFILCFCHFSDDALTPTQATFPITVLFLQFISLLIFSIFLCEAIDPQNGSIILVITSQGFVETFGVFARQDFTYVEITYLHG